MLCFVTSIVVSLQSRGVTSDKAEKGDGYAIDFEPSVYNPRVLKILGHDRTGTTMEQKILFAIYLSFKSTWPGYWHNTKTRDGRRVTKPLKQLLSVQKIDQDQAKHDEDGY